MHFRAQLLEGCDAAERQRLFLRSRAAEHEHENSRSPNPTGTPGYHQGAPHESDRPPGALHKCWAHCQVHTRGCHWVGLRVGTRGLGGRVGTLRGGLPVGYKTCVAGADSPDVLGFSITPVFSLRRGRTPTRAKHMCLATTPLQCTQECSEFEVFLLGCCLCLLWSLLREAPCGRLLMSHALCLPSAQRRRDDGLRSFWRTLSTSQGETWSMQPRSVQYVSSSTTRCLNT